MQVSSLIVVFLLLHLLLTLHSLHSSSSFRYTCEWRGVDILESMLCLPTLAPASEAAAEDYLLGLPFLFVILLALALALALLLRHLLHGTALAS